MSFRITLRSRRKGELERRIAEAKEKGWRLVRTNVTDTSVVASKHKPPYKLYVAVMERDNDDYEDTGAYRGGWSNIPTSWC